MTSRFDEDIDRRAVPALKYHRIVLGEGGEDLFAAGVADMDFKAPEPVLAALARRLEHGIFGYETVPDGLMPALVHWLATRHRWQVEAGAILRAPNILNALAIAASVFTREGDGVIVQPPVFFDFYDILEENHRELILNPLVLADGRYRMDFDDLERKAAAPRTRLMYLCNPHNPVGRVWTEDELRTVGEICARHDVLVVSDEIHGDITFPGHRYTPFASLGEEHAGNCIACVSPAKSFNLAACCSAFTIIADEDRRKRFQAENSRLTVNKNSAFASVAMEAAYRDGGPWLDEVIGYLKGNLDYLRAGLAEAPGVQLVEPEGTFLLWLDFRELALDADRLTAFLRNEARWAVTRGQAFGAEGVGFARMNMACTRARCEEALERLNRALRARSGAVGS